MRNVLRTKRALIGLAALAALVGGGGAIGATQLTAKEDSQAIIDDAAKRLGVAPEKLSDALEQAYGTRVDEAVEAGRLDEEQGAELKQRIESGEVPLVGVPGRRGHHGDHGKGRHGGPFGGLEAVTDYLGIDAAALRSELESGKSLAQVAEAQGKTVEGLKQAITAAATEKLDAAVTDGRLDAAGRQEMLDRLSERIDELVTRAGLPGRGLGGHRHGHHGWDDSKGAPGESRQPQDSGTTPAQPTSATV